jgi:hypothetical protein
MKRIKILILLVMLSVSALGCWSSGTSFVIGTIAGGVVTTIIQHEQQQTQVEEPTDEPLYRTEMQK